MDRPTSTQTVEWRLVQRRASSCHRRLQGKHKHIIIRAHHDPPVHGHPGINRTIQIVERNYWWPQLCQDVKDYVQGCADCQRHKVNNRPTKAPLRPIYPKPEAMPFETIALDFITKLPESQGYDSILTITDHDCTKAAIFIPCREEINAEGTAALYIQHVFAHFGLPRKSSAIETLDLCQNSCKKYAASQE
jgi:hypothetical protein